MQAVNRETKKIALVDKYALTRCGFMHLVKSLGGYEVTAQIDCIESFGKSSCYSPVDILVTDLFGTSDDINLQAKGLFYYHESHPTTHIIVFTSIQDKKVFSFLRETGNVSVISRKEPIDEMYRYIELALSGTHVISPIINDLVDAPVDRNTLRPIYLTPQENEVLSFYLNGLSVTQIARVKKRSIKTISAQKCSGMRKLGAYSDADLFLYKKRLLKTMCKN